jgi:hypothetical protein
MTLPDLTKPRTGDSCLLCGEKPSIIGIFTPEDPEAWGATGGKDRFFRYCLCTKCHERPDTPEKVEKIIRAELAGGVIHAD